MAETAWANGHRVLYHWQRFDEARLLSTLTTNRIYCASPGAFNDPWDCKPHFNSEVLADAKENQRHVDWAVGVCQRKTDMPREDLERMRKTLSTDRKRATELLDELSAAIGQDIDIRYRVFCLGPDVRNLLMWAHYSENHTGVCLEFDLQNDILGAALKCEYMKTFPLMKLYDDSDDLVLRTLLSKSDVWSYEQEYRLVAQERGNAIPGAETLITDDCFLQVPVGSLRAVVTGCQADHARVNALVNEVAPNVRVRRAVRIPNRYELAIQD